MIMSPFQASMRWFEGVVENRLDPLQVGRVQVRVFGIHTDNLINIPTQDLHWMQVMHPTTSPATSGVSDTPYMVEGTHVIGFFRDGDLCQDGVVLGTIAGIPQSFRNVNKGFNDTRTNISGSPKTIQTATPSNSGTTVKESAQNFPRYIDEPDLPRLTRNQDTDVSKIRKQNILKDIPSTSGSNFSEPVPKQTSQYPYNKVTEYESGHITEFDNTPSNERINFTHRVGTYLEFLSNGDYVSKSMNSKYSFSHNNSYEYTKNTKSVTVGNGYNLLVNGNILIEVGGSGNMTIKTNGDASIDVGGNFDINVDGDFTVKANTINLN